MFVLLYLFFSLLFLFIVFYLFYKFFFKQLSIEKKNSLYQSGFKLLEILKISNLLLIVSLKVWGISLSFLLGWIGSFFFILLLIEAIQFFFGLFVLSWAKQIGLLKIFLQQIKCLLKPNLNLVLTPIANNQLKCSLVTDIHWFYKFVKSLTDINWWHEFKYQHSILNPGQYQINHLNKGNKPVDLELSKATWFLYKKSKEMQQLMEADFELDTEIASWVQSSREELNRLRNEDRVIVGFKNRLLRRARACDRAFINNFCDQKRMEKFAQFKMEKLEQIEDYCISKNLLNYGFITTKEEMDLAVLKIAKKIDKS